MSFRIVYPLMSSMLDLLFFCRCFLLYAGLEILRKFLKYSQGEEWKVQYTKDKRFLSETKIPGSGHLLSPPSIFLIAVPFTCNWMSYSCRSHLNCECMDIILFSFSSKSVLDTNTHSNKRAWNITDIQVLKSLEAPFQRCFLEKYFWNIYRKTPLKEL